MGATKCASRAGFIFIGYSAIKKSSVIHRYRTSLVIQKASSRVVWSWSPVYCPVRPSCSSPSSRRAQHQVTRGGTARGKEGEDSNLKSAASWRGRISNGCFRLADERADDRTEANRSDLI